MGVSAIKVYAWRHKPNLISLLQKQNNTACSVLVSFPKASQYAVVRSDILKNYKSGSTFAAVQIKISF